MEVKDGVNSQRVIWFMWGIYYEWLTSTVLWMNYSKLHLMWNIKMVSLLYKRLQACCNNGSYFMSVLKIKHSSPGSHDKVVYMNFFCFACKSNQVWKLQYMVEPKILNLVLILCFVYNPYPDFTAVMMDNLDVCSLNLENANATPY